MSDPNDPLLRPSGRRLQMKSIQSEGDLRFFWLGEKMWVYVQFEAIGADGAFPVGDPPPVAWESSDPAVFVVREQTSVSHGLVVLEALATGVATLSATCPSLPMLQQKVEVTVRVKPEIEWF